MVRLGMMLWHKGLVVLLRELSLAYFDSMLNKVLFFVFSLIVGLMFWGVVLKGLIVVVLGVIICYHVMELLGKVVKDYIYSVELVYVYTLLLNIIVVRVVIEIIRESIL